MARERRLQDLFRRLADELDNEDALDELDDIRERVNAASPVSAAQILDLIEQAPADEQADLRRRLRELVADPDAPVGDPPPPPAPDPDPDPDPAPAPDPPPPARRTRPGRKSGRPYSFDVDDEGNVRDLDTAKIYNGPDEDDEVELPPDNAE